MSHHYKTTLHHNICWLFQVLLQFQTLQILRIWAYTNKKWGPTEQIFILYLTKHKIKDAPNGILKNMYCVIPFHHVGKDFSSYNMCMVMTEMNGIANKKLCSQISQHSDNFLNVPTWDLRSPRDLISKDSWIINRMLKGVTFVSLGSVPDIFLSLNREWTFHDPDYYAKYVPQTCKHHGKLTAFGCLYVLYHT